MYWFPAKRYGWGWGLPTSFGPLLAYVGILTALLIAICWLRGEPPRWRYR